MEDKIIELNSYEFSKMIKEDKNGILLDIRTPQEYRAGHIPNSRLMNIYDSSFTEALQKLDTGSNYYLYCRSGNRSYQAGIIMKKLGFRNIYNLSSGIIGWNEPLEK